MKRFHPAVSHIGVDHGFLLHLTFKTEKPQSLQNEFHQAVRLQLIENKKESRLFKCKLTKLLHRVALRCFYFEGLGKGLKG